MIEINVPKEHGGLVYTIKSIECNVIVECPKKCLYIRDKDFTCPLKSKFDEVFIKKTGSKIYCTKVLVNVRNTGRESDWYIGAEDLHLIDNDGFVYDGVVICDNIRIPKTSKDRSQIIPNTQTNYIQLFPALEKGSYAQKLIANIGGAFFEFNLSDKKDMCDSAENDYCIQEEKTSINSFHFYGANNDVKWELDNLRRKINNIKTDIYSIFNNVLTSAERTKKENSIRNSIFSLKLDLDGRKNEVFNDVLIELGEIECKFNDELSRNKLNAENERNLLSNKLDNLMELSPRDFEVYISQLYKSLGFEEVEVTPYSNDKGIDIVLYKNSEKYGIQCKRYKGTVGSPDIQKFIGALDHLNVDKGIFVTTGMFSFEAEKMASEHPIELVNRIELAKLILEATNKK